MPIPFRLKKTIGEAYSMDLEDSLNTKKALARLGHLEEPEDGFDEYPDRPMIDAVRSFQRANDLVEDGVMKPDGPTIARLNESLVARQERVPPPPGVIVINPDTDRERAPAASPVSLLASEPGDPYRRHLDSLPVRPGAAPLRVSKPKPDEGVKVAMARRRQPWESQLGFEGGWILNPFVGGGGGGRLSLGRNARSATDAAAGAGSAAAAGVAGAAIKDALKGDQKPAGNARSDILPPLPPLPGYEPAPEEFRKPQKTEFPAEPPEIPELKGFPVGDDAKAQLFIFQELHDDLKRSLTKPLESRRGDPFTERGNELIAGPCLDALKAEYEEELQKRVKHVGGGTRASDGQILKEGYLPEKETKARKGSSYADITLENELTGDKLHANTANMLKDGKTPVADERRKLYKMRNNADIHDVVTALPKLRPGMDEKEYVNRCIELLREPYYQWMGRPNGK